MLDNFLYSINAVAPMILIIILGKLLNKIGLTSEKFSTDSEKFVFKLALPAMLFLEISSVNLETDFDGRYILFCVVGISLTFLIPCLAVPLFLKENDRRGAFVQGIYRSNFAIFGTILADNMFGDSGVRQISMILPFAIVLFNVFAVTILSIYAPKGENIRFGEVLKKIFRNIFTNPLIISVVLAVPFLIFKWKIPFFAEKSITYISNLALPLALMSLGAGFKFETAKAKFPLAITASLIKTVILPVVMVTAGALLGYRGVQLGGILILFGGPAATSSYIMAKNMKSDYELARHILLLTTLLCSFTMFFEIFTLKSLGLI